jgi:benzoyl-CoA reductase/2-hydroxyglutaryl-CoA dehydratase subunit BcrC/BadD/HgdB
MDTEKIEKQLEKVSPIVKRVFFSTDVAEAIAQIGEENGLLLDQVNDLIEETGYMIIGLKPAKNFVDVLSNKLKIDKKIAITISTKINDTVLKNVRDEIRKLNEGGTEPKSEAEVPENLPTTPTISAIEQAGQFTVESDPASHSEQYNNTTTITKEATLNKIEEDHIPLVDHLLTTPISNPQKVEVKKLYTVDPYREQM